MTKQCIEAMEYLYAQEAKTCNSVEKAVIDEALEQMLKWTDSERDARYLVRDAMSNAKKKVFRYSNRNNSSDLEACESLASERLGIEMIDWGDTMDRAGLTERQRLIFLRCEQGYSIKEVAQEWGITEKSVYRIRQRARAVILDYIKIGA